MDNIISSSITKVLNIFYRIVSIVMMIWLVPLNSMLDWMYARLRPLIEPLVQNRTKILRLTFYSVALVCLCAFVSLVNYVAVYTYLVPKVSTHEPLYFDFGGHRSVVANTEVAVEFQRHKLYDIYLNLEMPESPKNEEIGMFMACLDLDNQDKWNPHKLLSVCRPATIKYSSPLIKTIKSVVYAVPYLLGLYEEKQTLSIPMVENLLSKRFYQTISVSVSILNKNVQIYSSSLVFQAKLSGLEYYMHHYPITSFVVGFCSLFIIWMIVVSFIIVSVYLYRFFNVEHHDQPIDDVLIDQKEKEREKEREREREKEKEKEKQRRESIKKDKHIVGEEDVIIIDDDNSNNNNNNRKKSSKFLFDDLGSGEDTYTPGETFAWENELELERKRKKKYNFNNNESSLTSSPTNNNNNNNSGASVNCSSPIESSTLPTSSTTPAPPAPSAPPPNPNILQESSSPVPTTTSSLIIEQDDYPSGISSVDEPPQQKQDEDDDNTVDIQKSSSSEEPQQQQPEDEDGSFLGSDTNSTPSTLSSTSSNPSTTSSSSTSSDYEYYGGNSGTLASDEWHMMSQPDDLDADDSDDDYPKGLRRRKQKD